MTQKNNQRVWSFFKTYTFHIREGIRVFAGRFFFRKKWSDDNTGHKVTKKTCTVFCDFCLLRPTVMGAVKIFTLQTFQKSFLCCHRSEREQNT